MNNISKELTDRLMGLVFFHQINIYFGALATLINLLLIAIFLSYRPFRQKLQLLIALTIADMCTSIGIMSMGIDRVDLYNSVLSTHRIPVQNSWICAQQPWIWIRVIGDLWPPLLQSLIGAERLIAVRAPIWYRVHRSQLRLPVIIGSGAFCIVTLAISLVIAYMNRNNPNHVPYYCGRKASFSTYIGTFIYAFIVVGYTIAFVCNSVAYTLAAASKSIQSHIRNRQLDKIRYLLIISFVSVVLVSIPNLISLTSSWIHQVDDVISKPAVWATCINASINLFVYLLLNEEFRRYCLNIIHRCIDKLSTSGRFDENANHRSRIVYEDEIGRTNILLH